MAREKKSSEHGVIEKKKVIYKVMPSAMIDQVAQALISRALHHQVKCKARFNGTWVIAHPHDRTSFVVEAYHRRVTRKERA